MHLVLLWIDRRSLGPSPKILLNLYCEHAASYILIFATKPIWAVWHSAQQAVEDIPALPLGMALDSNRS